MAETMPNPEQNQNGGGENEWDKVKEVPFAGEEKTFSPDEKGAEDFAFAEATLGHGDILDVNEIVTDVNKAWEMANAEKEYVETAQYWEKYANAVGDKDLEALTDLYTEEAIEVMQKSETGAVRALGNMDLVKNILHMLSEREAKKTINRGLDVKTGRTIYGEHPGDGSHQETRQEQIVARAMDRKESFEATAREKGDEAGKTYDNIQSMLGRQ